MSEPPLRVMLVDDHEVVRDGIKLLLNDTEDVVVCAEAGSARAAVAVAARALPDVIVMDVRLSDGSGIEATRDIRAARPQTAVLMLTSFADEDLVLEAISAGAAGYVLKQSPSAELVDAVRAAASGRRYLDRSLAARVAGTMLNPRGRVAPRAITDRESEVLRLMALGHSNKDIASNLDLSVKTVEVHKANAMRKLGLSGRTDVVRYALLQGWLRDP